MIEVTRSLVSGFEAGYAAAAATAAIGIFFAVDWLRCALPAWLARRRFATPPWSEHAADAGNPEGLGSRRDFLSTALEGGGFGEKRKGGASAGDRPRYRVVETMEGHRSLHLISRAEEAAQDATFLWQLRDPLLMRLGRAADLVLADDHAEAPARWRDVALVRVRVPLIRILAARLKRRTLRTFEPCIVVRGDDPRRTRDQLRKAAAWLGVATAIEPKQRFEQTGRCVASGLRGEAGGLIETRQGLQGLTCAHTLGADCRSVTHRAVLNPRTTEPDIALVAELSPCLPVDRRDEDYDPCDLDAAKLLTGERVRMTPCGRRGRVLEIAATADYSGRVHDFFHAQVCKDFGAFLDIPLTWGRAFSRAGDSGSWVLTDRNWLGVAVAARAETRTSYVVLAGPVMTYLDNLGLLASPSRCYPAAWRR